MAAFSLRSVVLAALVLGLMALPARGAQDGGGACGDAAAPYAEVQIAAHPRLNLELARTSQEHERGLMFRESLPPDSYVIHPGDTLIGIAAATGISLDRLISLNAVTNADSIVAGQTLALDGGGMLFIYQAPAREAYWMFNTLIPLSIAFIDRDGTIVDILDMARLNNPADVQEASRVTYPSAAPYWYALEVSQGWFVQHGVATGQQFTFCLGG